VGELVAQNLLPEETTVDISVNPATGDIEIVEAAPIAAAVAEPVEIEVITFSGFDSNITADTEPTRSVTAGAQWLALAAAYLNLPHGLTPKPVPYTIPGVQGATIIGFTVTITLTTEYLTFSGLTGMVIHQDTSVSYVVKPEYESHDTHGTNPGAGGGSGK